MMLANRILADPTIQFPPAVWIRLAATQPGSHHLYPQGEIAGPHPHGHLVNVDGSLADQTAVHLEMNADGGIVSTAEDTARFLTALMQDRLLGAAAATRPTCGSAATAAGLLRCF